MARKTQPAPDAPAMFETGSDPFGRPVAWATTERTGEQLDMLADVMSVGGCQHPGCPRVGVFPMDTLVVDGRSGALGHQGYQGRCDDHRPRAGEVADTLGETNQRVRARLGYPTADHEAVALAQRAGYTTGLPAPLATFTSTPRPWCGACGEHLGDTDGRPCPAMSTGDHQWTEREPVNQ